MACVSEQQLTIVGGLGFLFIFLSLWMAQLQPKKSELPKGFDRPGLAFQLVGTLEGIRTTLGPRGTSYRRLLRESINKDFVYIVGYTLLFTALGLTISRVGVPWAKGMGQVATGAAVFAAAFDCLENSRMLGVLALDLNSITDPMALGIRHASLVKWGLLFVALALIAVVLLWPRDRFSLIGVCLLLAALAGFGGLLSHRLLPLAMGLLGLGIIGVSITFTLWPDKFLKDFC